MDVSRELLRQELNKSLREKLQTQMREAFDTGNDLDGYAIGERIQELEKDRG